MKDLIVNMVVDTIVGNPESLRNLDEIMDVLNRTFLYEIERKCNAGVLLIQGGPLGGFYRIRSESEACKLMSSPVREKSVQCGIRYWTRSYFEALKDKLSGKDVLLPNPLTLENCRDYTTIQS